MGADELHATYETRRGVGQDVLHHDGAVPCLERCQYCGLRVISTSLDRVMLAENSICVGPQAGDDGEWAGTICLWAACLKPRRRSLAGTCIFSHPQDDFSGPFLLMPTGTGNR